MKFNCESCSAQYMISDEKVGPNGVKVRCKKCGNVVVVRRAASESSAPAPAPATNGAARGGNGLDDELGQAFDSVFGEPGTQATATAPAADLASTQAMGSEDQARIAAALAAAAAPAATEWYVAIGQAQVGPLPLSEVRRKWEAGDVGPDSLVWRPGMQEWQPLTSSTELATYLAPVPRAEAQAPAQAQPRRSEATAHRAEAAPKADPLAAAAAAGDVTWKPVGASALAALANEELATRTAPEPSAAKAPAGGVKSLVDALPDGGGVDPTGALPLSIKALETTGEKKIERRSSVASRAEETRHRRSTARSLVVAVIVVIAAIGGAAAYLLSQMKKLGPQPAGAVAVQKAPPAAVPLPPPPVVAAPVPSAPAPAPAADKPEVPLPPPPSVAAAPSAPAPAAEAPAPPAPAPKRAAGTRRVAKAEPARTSTKPPAAQAQAPAPTPAPAGKKKDALLDFDSKDSALDEALGGGGSSGRTVYVPPARAGGPALPEKLSPAQINESVAGRIDALRKCVTDQKSRDPGASGVLKLGWVIGGDGNVRDVKTLTTEYASSPFAQCITGVVKTIRFPKSATTGQEVTFPFSF